MPTTTTTAVPAPLLPGATYPPYLPLPGVTGVGALTGLAAEDAVENRPVLAVKVDNAPGARPQWALEAADVVFEENVESVTRFIALFHSRLPAEVGPVRSARSTDIDVLAAANRPVLAWSGGNAGVTALVRAADSAGWLRDGSALRVGRCYRRATERRAPHNLLADPDCLLAARPDAGPARPLWAMAAEAPGGGQPSPGRLTVAMDGVTVEWSFDPASGLYRRDQRGQPHLTWTGVHLGYTNVVVMEVPYRPSPIDARSPEATTVGRGPVAVHRNGQTWRGTWSRATATDPFTFTLTDGTPLALAPGTTFVHLARSI